MKAINWARWFLAGCVCASVLSTGAARYKFRHPQPPIYKKSWPMGPRISMGNSIHINMGQNGYKQNRPNIHNKPMANYNRYPVPNQARRPPMFAVLPAWKTQTILGSLANQGSLPQRGPVKEFHTMNKLAEYSPEYRPEQAIPSPTNRGEVDDDKGPIHTIPAPNLSPADKPYNIQSAHSYPANIDYTQPQSAVTNYLFGTQGTSVTPQRITTGPTSPTPTHYYEVTETNEIGPHQDYRTVQPTFLIEPEFDGSPNFATTGAQTNDLFAGHPSGSNTGLIGTDIRFGGSNGPMQTNLQSSLHVGFPASATQAQPTSLADQQTPDLHVGHPAPAGPPLSANQLYDLLNSFPQQLNDQYTAGSQQHLLQQQLDQILQSGGNGPQFSQPQMHSFNYDEQSNKLQQQQQQQQQQIFLGQDYASGRVTADYSLEPDTRNGVRNTNNAPRHDLADNRENNVDYNEETSSRPGNGKGGQSTYFTQIGQDGSVSTQFYTTLPNRDAAEKLAALAAAGNVNSHLIGQLRKQQADRDGARESNLPPNHKDENYNGAEDEQNEEAMYQQQTRYVHRGHQQREEDEEQQKRGQYKQQGDEKRPLRIMVPDLDEYSDDFDQRNSRSDTEATKDPRGDYEYEEDINEESELSEDSGDQRGHSIGNEDRRAYNQHSNSEFGSRLAADESN